MPIDILVLNYNGRELLAQCLPSIIEAAATSRHRCVVGVIDNASVDGSVAWLRRHYPQVELFRCENRGLCSYNEVLQTRDSRVAILLNNDIRLDRHAIDPLVAPLLDSNDADIAHVRLPAECDSWWMTTPYCLRFDKVAYEGLLTSVSRRYGLVRATAHFAGNTDLINDYHPTASAGAAMAVDRSKFLELGGFDPLYLPGRLEDLDLAFRAYLRGYAALFVPTSIAYHGGERTFRREFGQEGSYRLALRNTLLWQYKNLRDPWLLTCFAGGLLVRFLAEAVTAPGVPPAQRFPTWRALREAVMRWQAATTTCKPCVTSPQLASCFRFDRWRRERAFFRRFHPRAMTRQPATAHRFAKAPLPLRLRSREGMAA